MKGKVNWFSKQKGYGFITPDDGSKDVFVHYSGIIDDSKLKNLEKDQAVEFEVTENEKGSIATNVRALKEV